MSPLLRTRGRPGIGGVAARWLACAALLAPLACSEPEHQSGFEDLQPLPPTQGTEPASERVVPPVRAVPGDSFDERDWDIFTERVHWGVENRLDTLAPGAAVAAMGRTFVGWPYTPGTLEIAGPEGVVVNLREFDCVTFVENVLALTAFVRTRGAAALADRSRAEALYRGHLAALRYRGGGEIEYESRLHYFSEWLSDNVRRGHLAALDDALGAVPDATAIDFISSHPDAYPQMADPSVRTAIRTVEGRLNAGPPRRYLPESDLDRVDGVLNPGDVVAATSTLSGLDVAHTGIAVVVGERIHLLHAPLVGDSVEISPLPLAERIRRIEGQDGIMAARPAPGDFFGGSPR